MKVFSNRVAERMSALPTEEQVVAAKFITSKFSDYKIDSAVLISKLAKSQELVNLTLSFEILQSVAAMASSGYKDAVKEVKMIEVAIEASRNDVELLKEIKTIREMLYLAKEKANLYVDVYHAVKKSIVESESYRNHTKEKDKLRNRFVDEIQETLRMDDKEAQEMKDLSSKYANAGNVPEADDGIKKYPLDEPAEKEEKTEPQAAETNDPGF